VVTALIAGAVVVPASAPAAQRLYLSDFNTPKVGAYALAPGGAVGAALSGSPYATGSISEEGVAVTADGSSLYAVGHGEVAAFSIGGDGSLAPIDAESRAGTNFYGVAVSPDGRFVYAADNNTASSIFTYSRASDGTLTPIASSAPATVSLGGLAMASDGRHLYATAAGKNLVLTYSIAADGSLSTAPGSAVPGGPSPYGIALSPDGRFLYVVSSGPGSEIRTYAIAADGSLSAVGSPVPSQGDRALGLNVTPDGEHLYVANYDSSNLGAFSIGADGTPAPLAGSPVALTGAPGAIGIDATGDRLYVPDGSAPGTFVLSLDSSGLPAQLAGSPFPTGMTGEFQSVALSPDQPPTASFTTKVNNKRIAFDATGSTDPDGSVARYDWDFGDGGTLANGGPTPTHKYHGPKQPATLTVSDEAGCSTAYVSAGTTPYCNGGPSARLTLTPFQAKLHGGASQKLRGAVRVKLSCPVACDVKVVGRVKLSGRGTRAKKATLKGASRDLKPGRPKTLKLKLTGKGRRDAAAAKKAAARLKITAHDGSGDQFKVKRTIGLR
jgi:DNA-binding beta-propeller fold protein YncE